MSFETQADLAVDAIFLKKIRVAMAKVAILIAGETQSALTPEQWDKRQALATAVLNDPDVWEAEFAIATVTNEAITGSSLDSDIEFQVTAQWDDMAGVTGRNLT